MKAEKQRQKHYERMWRSEIARYHIGSTTTTAMQKKNPAELFCVFIKKWALIWNLTEFDFA